MMLLKVFGKRFVYKYLPDSICMVINVFPKRMFVLAHIISITLAFQKIHNSFSFKINEMFWSEVRTVRENTRRRYLQ